MSKQEWRDWKWKGDGVNELTPGLHESWRACPLCRGRAGYHNLDSDTLPVNGGWYCNECDLIFHLDDHPPIPEPV